MNGAPEISDVFPFMSPAAAVALGPGRIALPNGDILDGVNATTAKAGSPEWAAIMRSLGGYEPVGIIPFEDPPPRDVEISTGIVAAPERSTTKTLLVIGAIVALVLYLTRGK